MNDLIVSAPGKLMLSGEWSVLELGVPCIVMAVNKKVYVKISENPNNRIKIFAPDLELENISCIFNSESNKLDFLDELTELQKSKLAFAQKAIEITLTYLKHKGIELKNFFLNTKSESVQITLDSGETKKIGFGSSAAITVAIVGAILSLHGQEIDSYKAKEKIYKISALSHYLGQGKLGSAFDIAASSFGGVLYYKKFDPNWLVKEFETGKKLNELIEEPWNYFEATPITLPKNFQLIVGWTKKSASTKELVKKINAVKDSVREEYNKIVEKIKQTTNSLNKALANSDEEKILFYLKQNREFLQEFASLTKTDLETEDLKKLADLAEQFGAAGKFSGAGGGDSGIAVTFSSEIAEKIKQAWIKANLYPLNVSIAFEGVKLESK